MRSCVIKVKTIYSVLCSLYNMKTKDLKEKVYNMLLKIATSTHDVIVTMVY